MPLDNSIDLLNVDYDDVLHLYRGWRKSEDIIKEKEKENQNLLSRLRHLEDSNLKSRSQLQALQSVKELTNSLQAQLSVMQQENSQIASENKDLAETNNRFQEMLHTKSQEVESLRKALSDSKLENQKLSEKYKELVESKTQTESIMYSEHSKRTSNDIRLRVSEETSDELRRENKNLRSKLDEANNKLQQCDNALATASEQLRKLSIHMESASVTKESYAVLEAQNVVLRGDIARLLRLLEYYPATKDFLRIWQDSEGLSFVGGGDTKKGPKYGINKNISADFPSSMSEDTIQLTRPHSASRSHKVNSSFTPAKSSPDLSRVQSSGRSGYSGVISLGMIDSNEGDNFEGKQVERGRRAQSLLSSADLSQLRRVHKDEDAYPMTASIQVLLEQSHRYSITSICLNRGL